MDILGLMSGTSFDGVDAAMVSIENGRVAARGQSHFEAYRDDERAILRNAMGGWVPDQDVLDVIHAAHNRAIEAVRNPFELVGFHGQTLAHDPAGGRTLQAGDPAALQTNCPIVYDFRSDDVALGGEGAPLIPIYHYALSKELGLCDPIAFVNIGGVANVTYVDPKLPPEEGLIAFDCGPGNAIMDDLVFEAIGHPFDIDGKIAAQGRVNKQWLNKALAHPFFSQKPPKSLDRDAFFALIAPLKAMDLSDALASAAGLSIAGLQIAEQYFPHKVTSRIICGGGRNNKTLMAHIDGIRIEDMGLDGDMTEAEGFAYLADCVINNRSISFPMTTGVGSPVVGGKIYRLQNK